MLVASRSWTARIAAVVFSLALAGALAFSLPSQAQAQARADELLTTSTQASESSAAGSIAPGEYYIQSRLSGKCVLDVEGASTASGANVQLWEPNGTKAQRWRVERAEDGSYTLRCSASGRYLGTRGASSGVGSNAEQTASKASAAQRWTIAAKGDAFVISPAENGGVALDAAGTSASSGANVRLAKAKSANSQCWWFIPVKPKVSSGRTIADGVYEMRLNGASSYALGSVGSGYANGTGVRLQKTTATTAQRWAIHRESDGYYSIRNVSSGKMLSFADSVGVVRTNVVTWAAGTAADRRWAIVRNANGSYTLTCKANGLALDVAGAKAANGTNVRLWARTAGRSQQLALAPAQDAVPEGAYTLYTMLAPTASVVDIPGASMKAGLQAQIYVGNGTMAQRFYVRPADDGTCTIQSLNSGLYLADVKGKVVQQKRSQSAAQRWSVTAGAGVAFTNAATGKRLAVKGAKSANGAKLVTTKAGTSKAQRFRLVSMNLISDGIYALRNVSAKKMLDVAGSSTKAKANVQVRKAGKKSSQAWSIAHVSGEWYRLIDVNSGKALEVAGSSKKAGANVRQSPYKKQAAQLWSPRLRADGSFVFTNKASGMVLEAAGTKNGANVRQAAAAGRRAQAWKVSATSSGDTWKEIELNYLDNPSVTQILEVQYWGGSDAWVQLRAKKGYTWKTQLGCWGYVGAAGIGQASMWSTRTPSGDFGITHAFGIKSDPGAWLPYVQVTQDMWWCGDRTAYNQLIYMSGMPHNCDGEHLIDYAPHYNYGLFFDYNTNPIVYGAGAAFFVHCTGGQTYTGGCVAVDEWYMKRLIRKIKPGARLCIY